MHPGFTIALQTRDFASRKNFLDNFRKSLDANLFCNDKNENGIHDSELILDVDDPSTYYPVLLRLAYECPFKDVRFACEDILSKLESKGIRVPRRKIIGPSRFISSKVCVGIDTDDQEVQDLYVDAFLLNGRTSHIHQLLAYHIRYFSCFVKFEVLLMKSNGALPLDWRYYIGIMAASKHRCGYLVDECKENFLLESGNEKWLDGIQYAPIKLQKLDSLNRMLAHQPWLISEKIIEELLAGPAAERWSVSELIHAVLVMAHYLALSGLVFGCGVNPEIDMKNGHTVRSQSASGYSSSGSEPLTPTKIRENSLDSKLISVEEAGTTTGLLERIQRVQQEEYALCKTENEQEEKLRQFQEVENKELTENESEMDITSGVNLDCSFNKFNHANGDFHYEEYQKMKPKNISVFRAQDFNWQEHCFSFIDHSFPSMGFSLDEKFSCTYELTYRTIGGSVTNIDTSKFRLATWNYIHLIYGIYHDDYQYVEVNKLLEKSYKSFIKKVACFPEQITLVDFEDFFTDFLPSEKVHINLLVLESRFQAILLYASRSIMNHMNKIS